MSLILTAVVVVAEAASSTSPHCCPVKECQENAASPVTCLKALTWATVAATLTQWTNAAAEIPEVAICSNERQKVCILPSALKIEQYGSTKT